MFHFNQGQHTTQGHKGIAEGCFEEEQGRKGFFGQVSHIIKNKPSTRWETIEGPLKPQCFSTNEFNPSSSHWNRLLFNQDVGIYSFKLNPEKLNLKTAFRNADGESLYFCHEGKGVVFTEYGVLNYEKGHYVLIPKCVQHTFVPESQTHFLVIESRVGAYREPDRGMVGRNAVYDIEAFKKPDLQRQHQFLKDRKIQIKEIQVKRNNQMTTFKYPDCVYADVLGWKGDFFPVTLHINDLMPLLSHRVHLPPSAHTTFVSNNFVVCTFAPRPLESDADALKVPFYHQNIDYDEVIFYHAGDFFSRDNIKPGSITFHPAGFPHGPHPKAIEKVKTQTHTQEYAVMIDTWNPLNVDDEFLKTEVTNYWRSWQSK